MFIPPAALAAVTALQSLPEIDPDATGLEGWVRNAVVLASIGLVAYVLARTRTSTIYREERDAYKVKAERLEEENKTLTAAKAESDRQLAEALAKTDLTALRAEIKDGLLTLANMQREVMTGMQEITRAVLASQSHTAATFESLERMFREGRSAGG